MGIKQKVKSMLLGPPGVRVRTLRRGLLKGLKFQIDTANKSQRLLGMDEIEVAGWTRRLTRGAAVALDIGANDGWYSVYFASQPGIARVYGFEPDADLVRVAMENLQLNGQRVADRARIEAKFVGDQDNERWLRIDTLLSPMQASGPFVMKVDVDGGEVDVLRGGAQTLKHQDCRLVIETHSTELERDCIAFLTRIGFKVKVVRNGWYRAIMPEERNIPHNRWLAAWNR